jgi:hypothetical protein
MPSDPLEDLRRKMGEQPERDTLAEFRRRMVEQQGLPQPKFRDRDAESPPKTDRDKRQP